MTEVPSGPLIAGQRLITADHVCAAFQATLERHLPEWLAHLSDLSPVTEWLQLPTTQAITAAQYPTGTVVSPGLSGAPVRRTRTVMDATWRVMGTIYDRGPDHTDVQRRARTWAALMRAVLLQHRSLGGLASGLEWIGEEYGVINASNAARTFGACTVSVDVTVEDVVPSSAPPAPGLSATGALVTSTASAVSVLPIS